MKWESRRKSASLICVWLFLSFHIMPMPFRTTSTCIHILHQSSVLVFRSPKSMTSWKGELKNSYLLIFVVTLGFPIPCKVLPAVYKMLFCSPIPCSERGAYSFSCLWAFSFDLLEMCLIFWLSLQECSLSVLVLWNPSMLFWDFWELHGLKFTPQKVVFIYIVFFTPWWLGMVWISGCSWELQVLTSAVIRKYFMISTSSWGQISEHFTFSKYNCWIMGLVLLGTYKVTSWNGKSFCQQLEHILDSVTIFSQTMFRCLCMMC